MACLRAHPFIEGAPDQRANNSVKCAYEFLNGVHNLNNTDAGLNRDWKGRVITAWCRAYTTCQGDIRSMKSKLNREDISMASMLRDSMRLAAEDKKPWTKSKIVLDDRIFVEPTPRFSVISIEPGGGENYVPERYAPNWARRIEKEMSKSAFSLVDLLHERDGEIGVMDFAESLKVICTSMDLTGSA